MRCDWCNDVARDTLCDVVLDAVHLRVRSRFWKAFLEVHVAGTHHPRFETSTTCAVKPVQLGSQSRLIISTVSSFTAIRRSLDALLALHG